MKELKKKQKDLKENSARNLFQRSRFLDLKKLLATKMELYSSGVLGVAKWEDEGEGKESRGEYGANVMEVVR